MKIFYHDDLDGKCAAYIVSRANPKTATTFCPMKYHQKLPLHIIAQSEDVYILDFSIPPHEMGKLLNITPNVIWIDHHLKAINTFDGFEHEIPGIRNTRKATCALAYEWCHPDTTVPEFVALIGDRDTWTWKYGNKGKFFCAAVSTINVHPQSPMWDDIKNNPGKYILMGAKAT